MNNSVKEDSNINPIGFHEELNIREELDKYVFHWKWFIVTGFTCLIMAFIFLRYVTPQYKVKTTLLIKEDQSTMSSELAAFQDLGMFAGGSSNIENEIELLKSRSLAATVVDDLNLTVSYYKEGNIKESEVYKGEIELKKIKSAVDLKEIDTTFYVNFISFGKLQLLDANKDVVGEQFFDTPFSIGEEVYVLTSTEKYTDKTIGTQMRVQITKKHKAVNSLVGAINVSPAGKHSGVLILELQHPIKEKAAEILNTLLINYEKEEIHDKSEVSENTAFFVGERVKIVRAELSEIDQLVEQYKFQNNLTDIEKESEEYIKTVSASENALFDATTQSKLLVFMREYLEKEKGSFGLIPALGFTDPSINSLTTQYNQVVLDRNRVLRNSTANNPAVLNYEAQLLNLRKSLKESLENLDVSLAITIEELTKKDQKLNSQKSSIPRKEREYKTLIRQQGIKEALYLYLLQKQEETQITLAVTTANSKVIDVAYGSDIPVSPKRNIVLLAGLLLGLIIPFAVIYLRDLLDNKLHTRKDLEAMVSVPVLGDIPIKESKENIVVSKIGRSSSAEAFRLLRTNIDFMLTGNEGKGKTIFLTSTTGGEGKSFVSINLACTLALSGKKVALLGMDLRAPKITEYLEVPNRKGITNYILDESLSLDELKFSIEEHDNVDFYASGVIPPNPAELLLHTRVKELFAEIKEKYDYVIVDTAPVNLVTDTLLLSDYADLFIYVARANYLDKRLLSVPQALYTEKRLPNMAMLINGSDYTKGYGSYGGYGGYGYGHDTTKKPWWKKVFKA